MFLYYLDPDGLTVEHSFGMEEFPAEGARKPRVMDPIKASIEFWGASSLAEPKFGTGAFRTPIVFVDTAPHRR